MTAQQIATTIRNQIQAGTDRRGLNRGSHCMACWGTNKLAVIPANDDPENFHLGGLQFKVQGAKHRGFVEVTLLGNDTYRINIFTRRKVRGKMEMKTTTKYDESGLYCDQLTEIIDSEVESGQ